MLYNSWLDSYATPINIQAQTNEIMHPRTGARIARSNVAARALAKSRSLPTSV